MLVSACLYGGKKKVKHNFGAGFGEENIQY